MRPETQIARFWLRLRRVSRAYASYVVKPKGSWVENERERANLSFMCGKASTEIVSRSLEAVLCLATQRCGEERYVTRQNCCKG